MRRCWKRLAERAGNTAFGDGERREALAAALEADWRAEVPDSLVRCMRRILDDPQGDRFRDSTIAQLEQSRDKAAGRPLAGALLDCAIQVVDQGHCGKEALERRPVTPFRSAPRADNVKWRSTGCAPARPSEPVA